MNQNALTLVTPIQPDRLADLDSLLTQIGTNLRHNPYLDISLLSTTHFMRWVILPGGGDTPARLLFESNHDGTERAYLLDLITQAGCALDAIYAHCAGYPVPGVTDPQAVLGYLQAHSAPCAAFYLGYRGRSVATVKAALDARARLGRFLDEAQARHAFDGQDECKIWEAVQAEAARTGIAPLPPQTTVPPAVYGLAAGGALLGLSALLTKHRAWLPVLGVVGGLVAFLRWRETKDAQEWQATGRAKYLPSYESHSQVKQLAVREDILAQNQLTHVVPLRPGVFRRVTAMTVLRAIHLLAKIIFNKGSLGGIPTIHFARWVLLGDGQLLFFSNYDGSWDNYLGDFVDRAASGLTGVWSNTEDFPPTRLLTGQGARQVEFFKAWTRAYQIPTQLWYSAYPDNTVVNVRDALATLENLGQRPTPETAGDWLRRL